MYSREKFIKKVKILERIKHSKYIVFLYDKLLNLMVQNIDSYVFVATTGRSGSKSLCRIFNAAEGAICFHETPPVMLNICPKNVDRQKYFDRLFFRKKIIEIKKNSIGYRYYIETNHMFAKTFYRQAIKSFGDKIKIIHLKRDPVKVATSFYRIGSIPGKTYRGKLYLLDPNDSYNLLPIPNILNSEEFNDDLYKCIWYWYEMEARIQKMKIDYPRVKFYQINIESLNNFDKSYHMFNSLEIRVDVEKLKNLVGVQSNRKDDENINKISLEKSRLMHEKLFNKMKEKFGPDFKFI
jgi:hypothetical protein